MSRGRVNFEAESVTKTGFWKLKDEKAECAPTMSSAIRVLPKAQSSQVIAEQAPNAQPYH
jgi:hypothetical protein